MLALPIGVPHTPVELPDLSRQPLSPQLENVLGTINGVITAGGAEVLDTFGQYLVLVAPFLIALLLLHWAITWMLGAAGRQASVADSLVDAQVDSISKVSRRYPE